MPRKKKGSSRGSVSVDFEGVTSFVLLPEGDFPLRVVSIEQKESNSSDHDYLKWEFEAFNTGEDRLNGSKVFHNTSLSPKALWNLRGLLEAMEEEVPDGPMDLVFDELIDCEILATIKHEEYDGKDYARIEQYAIYEESGEGVGEVAKVMEETDDEDPPKKSKKKSKKPPKLATDEVKDMDVEELEDVVNTYELDVDLDDYKGAKKKVNAVLEALEEENFLTD